MTTESLIYFAISLAGILLSFVLGWRLSSTFTRNRLQAEERGLGQSQAHHLVVAEQQVSVLTETNQQLKKQLAGFEDRLQAQSGILEERTVALVAAQKEREAAADKLKLLEQSEQRLGQQFENLANKIFEQKSHRFSQQNRETMEGMLGPFKQQLTDFRQQVAQSYDNEAQQRRSLKDEISGLKELNQRMSQEALNLTRALKGEKKTQGNWGELVLDRVLEESGLREGHEYIRQVSLRNDEGERQQPDVIVHLPDGKGCHY